MYNTSTYMIQIVNTKNASVLVFVLDAKQEL